MIRALLLQRPFDPGRQDVLRCSEDRVGPSPVVAVRAGAVVLQAIEPEVPDPMRLAGRSLPVLRALILGSLVFGVGVVTTTADAQPWSPLVREYRDGATADVYFEAHSIRETDLGIFEIRLLYEPVAWVCLRRDRDGDCIDEPDRLLLSTRITVIRIRCSDMSFEEVDVLVKYRPFGEWRQMRPMDFRHPPGWRYGIAPWIAVAAARDLVCATVPP